MKVYLAAPYSAKDLIKGYANELRASGVEVTSSWLDEPHKPNTQMHDLTHEEHQGYAVRDVQDVQVADILVLFTDSTKTIIRAGRHVEFGIAVQRKIPIYVVGDLYENIFHHLPGVTHFKSWTILSQMLITNCR